jgi:hypothetical protein
VAIWRGGAKWGPFALNAFRNPEDGDILHFASATVTNESEWRRAFATETLQLRSNGDVNGDGDAFDPIYAGSGGASDEVLVALCELDAALKENALRASILFERIAEFRLARMNGRPWTSILVSEDEPSTVKLISTIHRRHAEASGQLRRSLTVALRAEGQSIPFIAHLFGVTHQRISNLLRSAAKASEGESEVRVAP